MKSLFTFLFFIGIIQNSHALLIQEITVSNTDGVDINIHTRVSDGYYFEYYNHNFSVVENVITLNICYSPYLMPVGTIKENDFVIPNVNIDTQNYTLVVNVYKRRNVKGVLVCDNPVGSDSETLQFSSPLNGLVALSSTNFNTQDSKQVTLFPNPTHGLLTIASKDAITAVDVFDHLGRKVNHYKTIQKNQIDLSHLQDGIYLVVIISAERKVVQKLILKK
ncbi:MAG: T9SS type A sorting domain-containing protein [Flavobacterium sp.]|nr:T9SS type A sorting domain-containing protein [Flavobacterium sp.]